jgi:hypothetical protein
MKIGKIAELLDAEILSGEEFSKRRCTRMRVRHDERCAGICQESGCFAYRLVNQQSVRTAMMMDMRCLVFVRSIEATEDMIELARRKPLWRSL